MKLWKAGSATFVIAALALTATGCGSDGETESPSRSAASGSKGKIVIGIKFDQPGVGLKQPDGSYAGFDVDVARYVAKKLGYMPGQIQFKKAPSAQREQMIKNGDVKFVVASYSINDKREKEVDFAGPYFLAHQDLLVRAGDKSITKPEDLNGKKLCSVTGSTSAQNVKEKLAPKADLLQRGGYSECLTGLENKAVDAVTTDDAILAGYAAQAQHKGKFKLAGLKLSDEKYGIGLKEGDVDLKKKIDAALTAMVADGSWDKAVQANFGPAGFANEPAPKITAAN
ncbi:glutamate ABC transporter substrate-binding protein [Streptomyces bambusae]|uniref:glutamate ABC transporter substrate-binding protein n=1 Tax=Streptomyces bambusae TaxID=1550616 RepID=UPI001CFEEF11|nr:glutamate ABC transporter substrate-binding protein [Streptomyces bambusae]MCB5164627.1 glutamate ABC transporter substrate-binding protein [Streptomyces bambusae]